jgi:hypothetical protein
MRRSNTFLATGNYNETRQNCVFFVQYCRRVQKMFILTQASVNLKYMRRNIIQNENCLYQLTN